jgi:hypothetical protein
MSIKPTYVTFEQAKLLKEKGFDVECKYYFDIEFKELTFHIGDVGDTYKNSELVDKISAPEQWQVIEWLRIKHGVWIYALPCADIIDDKTSTFKPNGKWISHCDDVTINKPMVASDTIFISLEFNSPQEAYSAAFDYVLTKLILK